MDPYAIYKKQLEYYEYFEKQKENYTDLTGDENPNSSVKQFAEILFRKKGSNLTYDLSGILFDETMEVADVFCVLVELVLYGLDIITNSASDIFALEESGNEIVNLIRSYLKSTGFDIIIKEEFLDDSPEMQENINLYRDRTDYYCQIVKKPPPFLCFEGWYVLNYRLINNRKYIFNNSTPLDNFKAFFITNSKKIFTVNFKYATV